MLQCLSSIAVVGKYVWFESSLMKWVFYLWMQQSSVKLVDPALEPYFKPLDDVITLADIEEQLELASQEEKVPLYLEPLYLGD